MKKIIFSIYIGILPITTFPNFTEPILKYVNQSNSIEAYMSYQGNWHTGKIYYEQSQYGIKLLQYNFETINTLTGRGLRGSFDGNEKFIALNPNNDFAIKYNFTHFIDLEGLKAYIISN
jgi:hypothetical protein